ncbi:MAG: hypothetical protein F4W93_04315 [Dehalococcoidia bacterium]|nr:hypothetical protein [Dehalococcoidia bacterium]
MTNKNIRNILRVQEQLRFQLLPYTKALQALEKNTKMMKINQDVIRLSEITRAALVPVEELSRRVAYMPSILETMEEFQKIQELVQVSNERFYLPNLTNAIQLLQEFEKNTVLKTMERYNLQLTEIHRSFETMRNSWLDTENQLQSLDGFVALKGIGHALSNIKSFDVDMTEALRIDLGDWREEIVLQTDVIANPVVRASFYEAKGLNTNLTAFPSATFDELVISSGIKNQPSDHYGDDYLDSDQENSELEIAFERTNVAHDTLQRFETEIRKFIDDLMKERFGSNWIKHRVPGEMCKQWKEKQQKAKDHRENVWPLISYADFSDYVTIITMSNNWQEVFEEIFVRKSSIQESFQRLFPIRLSTMHSRVITQDDELYLFVETKRILLAIRRFKS